MKFAVVQFPGSNCDLDCFHAVKNIMGFDCDLLWHQEKNLDDYDCVILPGGFSYGDYLRAGAIARFSSIMESLMEFASKGKLVIGICNGFQILTEAGLLPGALVRNRELSFICEYMELEVVNNTSPFSNKFSHNQNVRIPIAHGEGNYQADEETLQKLESNNQIIFKYKNNPNGSRNNIAGIMNIEGNVLGMMPHPERCVEHVLGGIDGKKVFESIYEFWKV